MLIYGKNAVNGYLQNNNKINKIYIWDGFSDKKLKSDLQKLNIEQNVKTKYEMNQIANVKHQGIILDVPEFEYSDINECIKKDKSFIVILDHLEDPHNFGAIIRTCEAAGVDMIVIPKNRSVEVNQTVISTSVGCAFNIPIAMVTNLNNTIKKLKEENFWIYTLDMDGENFKDISYPDKTCLIIGSEGDGVSRLIRENSDYIVSLPMLGNVNSLNASVAAGIMIYDIISKK